MEYRAYKYRFYPTAEQRQQLEIEFGNARFVWNWAIGVRRKAYGRRKQRHNYASLSKLVNGLKKTSRYAWLSNSTAACLIQKLKDLDHAYLCFFEGQSKYPVPKGKHGRQSVRYQLDPRHIQRLCVPGKHLQLPNLGVLRLSWSRLPNELPKMVTVSRDSSGRYFVSFGVYEAVQRLPRSNKAVGLDLGIKALVVTSDGEYITPKRSAYRFARQRAQHDRRLMRRQYCSKRWHKQRLRLGKIHARISDSRRDFLHKLTTRLVRENQVIAIEDLNIRGMIMNHCWSKALVDASLSEIRRQLEYKAKWYGRELIVIDRFAPTSKTCSLCGEIKNNLALGDRVWTCEHCQTTHDRDLNAAINVLNTAGRAGIDARGAWNPPKDAAAGLLHQTAGAEA
jgi:putative transposase